MPLRFAFYGAFYLNFFAIGATSEATVDRTPACDVDRRLIATSPRGVSAIRIGEAGEASQVAIFRPTPETGWASARLLARFDVDAEASPETAESCDRG